MTRRRSFSTGAPYNMPLGMPSPSALEPFALFGSGTMRLNAINASSHSPISVTEKRLASQSGAVQAASSHKRRTPFNGVGVNATPLSSLSVEAVIDPDPYAILAQDMRQLRAAEREPKPYSPVNGAPAYGPAAGGLCAAATTQGR